MCTIELEKMYVVQFLLITVVGSLCIIKSDNVLRKKDGESYEVSAFLLLIFWFFKNSLLFEIFYQLFINWQRRVATFQNKSAFLKLRFGCVQSIFCSILYGPQL